MLRTSNSDSFFDNVHDLSLPTGMQYETGWHIDIELVNRTNGMVNLVTTNDGVGASMDVDDDEQSDGGRHGILKTPPKKNLLNEPSNYSSLPSSTLIPHVPLTSVAFAILILIHQ